MKISHLNIVAVVLFFSFSTFTMRVLVDPNRRQAELIREQLEREKFAISLEESLGLTKKAGPYEGYRVLPKTEGRKIGFILESKEDQKRLFFKTDVLLPEQAFCISILSRLVKAPELRFYFTSHSRDAFIESQDLTRTYFSKNKAMKNQSFISYRQVISEKNNLVQDIARLKEDNFRKLRVSLAKLAILVKFMHLEDLSTSNFGLVKIVRGNETIAFKAAIIDFDMPFKNESSQIKLELRRKIDVEYFNQIFEFYGAIGRDLQAFFKNQKLYPTHEDYQRAFLEISHPKIKAKNNNCYLKPHDQGKKTTFEELVAEATIEYHENRKLLDNANIYQGVSISDFESNYKDNLLREYKLAEQSFLNI